MGIFDGMKKSTYRREIIAYINLNTDINYREVYSEKELEKITEHIFREVRSCNGSMRDFGAVFLKYVLENDEDYIRRLPVVALTLDYLERYTVKSVFAEDLLNAAKSLTGSFKNI